MKGIINIFLIPFVLTDIMRCKIDNVMRAVALHRDPQRKMYSITEHIPCSCKLGMHRGISSPYYSKKVAERARKMYACADHAFMKLPFELLTLLGHKMLQSERYYTVDHITKNEHTRQFNRNEADLKAMFGKIVSIGEHGMLLKMDPSNLPKHVTEKVLRGIGIHMLSNKDDTEYPN